MRLLYFIVHKTISSALMRNCPKALNKKYLTARKVRMRFVCTFHRFKPPSFSFFRTEIVERLHCFPLSKLVRAEAVFKFIWKPDLIYLTKFSSSLNNFQRLFLGGFYIPTNKFISVVDLRTIFLLKWNQAFFDFRLIGGTGCNFHNSS